MSRILNTKTTLKKLIKKINKENTPPGGWKKSDKPQASSAKLGKIQAASFKPQA